MKPRAILIRAPGTNCDLETQRALELAGARVDRVHVRALLAGRPKLSEFDILAIPGGFSYGDDVAAGKIFANELAGFEPLRRFVEAGKPVLGICNGFQVLVKAGLLPDVGRQSVSLAFNDSGRFECRWVKLKVPRSNCLFTQGLLDEIELPVAHGEGKFAAESDQELDRLESSGRFALLYGENPNGSERDVAGLCNEKGNCLGLMPHPERFASPYLHPGWTRSLPAPESLGLRFFENAVRYVK
jgi:phosphoribosylformylglycinamidine synthase